MIAEGGCVKVIDFPLGRGEFKPFPVPESRVVAAPKDKRPLIVALYGGPGTGKSTTAALLFGRLKLEGVNCELVHEVAKDMTWEDRTFALSHQPSLIAKQLRNYDRLYGKVDCIITDTSPLLASIYLNRDAMTLQTAINFMSWVRSDWRDRRTLDVFLHRDSNREYNPAGRSQSQQEAEALDQQIAAMLAVENVDHTIVYVDKDTASHVDKIAEETLRCLRP